MHEDEALVTIATFETEMEASLARGALEAMGIRALVPGEGRGTFAGPYHGSVREAELQVLVSDRERALFALRRMQFLAVRSDLE
jgi:hypothetical protein